MFANKVILITGASSGIGAQTAQDFSKLGANLVITGRNIENLNKVAKECEELSPNKYKPLVVISDVSKESDIENIMKLTIERWQQLDVLINNAGIGEAGTIETTNLEQYERVMNTNIKSVYHLTMLAAPHLIKSKGNIVNVSSIAGVRSFPNFLTYCVSKAALDQFTRCTALDLAPKGVRVNSVNPGAILTGIHMKGSMTQKEYDEFLEKCKVIHPIGRAGYSNEVSSAIVYLAGDGATNITGVTLPVDGGRHAMCPR